VTRVAELNAIEAVWRDLNAHHLAHQTFADTDALDRAILQAVEALMPSAWRFRPLAGLCLVPHRPARPTPLDETGPGVRPVPGSLSSSH
jgi:hypothetical protein